MTKPPNCATCRYADSKGYCTKHSYYKPDWFYGCSFHKFGTEEYLIKNNFYYYPNALKEQTK